MRYATVLVIVCFGISIQADCGLKRCNDVEIGRVFVEFNDLKIALAHDSSNCAGVYLVLSRYQGNDRFSRAVKNRLELAVKNGDLISFAKSDCATDKISYQVLAR